MEEEPHRACGEEPPLEPAATARGESREEPRRRRGCGSSAPASGLGRPLERPSRSITIYINLEDFYVENSQSHASVQSLHKCL
jgi:hypothetical protein